MVQLVLSPLMAAGGPSSFSLDEKEPKNQVRKKLPRCRQNTLARFSDRPLPASDFALIKCFMSYY
jgi:hypothetical protein